MSKTYTQIKFLWVSNALLTAFVLYKIVVISSYFLRLSNPLDYTTFLIYRFLISFFENINLHYGTYLLFTQQTILNEKQNLFLILLILIIMLIIQLVYLYRTYLRTFEPLRYILNKTKSKKSKDTWIVDTTQKLSKKLEVEPPDIYLSDLADIGIVSASIGSKNIIVASKKIFETLNKSELESIIAHELWHIKTDMEEITRIAFFTSISPNLSYQVAPLFLVGLFIIGFFKSSLFILLIDLFILILLFNVFLVTFGTWGKYTAFGALLPEYREFEADFMSALIIKKPEALASAIKKIIHMSIVNVMQNVEAPSFISQAIPDRRREKKWNDLVKPSWKLVWRYYYQPNPYYRIKMLELVDKLLKNHVDIKIKKQQKNISKFSLLFPNFILLGSNFARRINDENLKKFYSYLRANPSFNLVKASISLEIPESETLSMFTMFLMRDVIEIIAPSIN